MKNYLLFLWFFVPAVLFGQVSENFSDGDFANNPIWNGTVTNFMINSSFQLQSKATATSKSYLTTLSEAFENGTWEVWIKINYAPTSSNYASFYIISDRADVSGDFNGYFVQIGHNTSKDIALYLQKGASKIKIIDGIDLRTSANPCEIKIKVTRDANGFFSLFSKLPTDADYVLEGTTTNNEVKGSKYVGLFYSNTSTTGNAYFFDDVFVIGDKFLDIVPPVWNSLELIGDNQLKLTFSEAMDFSNSTFSIDDEIGNPTNKTVSADGISILLTFGKDFEKGKIYTVNIENAVDLSGNKLTNTQKQIGVVEKPETGDVVINEICFEAAEHGEEYFEIYNTSEKVIDLSRLLFTTRKTDGTMNAGYAFPANTILIPREYVSFTPSIDSIKKVYFPPLNANIAQSEKWYSLNNSGGNLLITNTAKDTIYDEIKYDVKWHHPLIKNEKGVSLEKINPTFFGLYKNSWHSASSEVNYGTPGYENSQFRTIDMSNKTSQEVWLEPESFSPDNDGINDVCFIRYKTNYNGFVANVSVYNSVGVEVKQLAKNQLLSTEGFLMWDGSNQQGKIANSNVYVVYFETINLERGIKIIKKLPVVLSIR
ncbi:MAG: lamin tail domain-containing protein [Paludibacteraceae bacterium]